MGHAHSLYITNHALDRFRIHHPDASGDDLRTYLHYGDVVAGGVVKGLLHRSHNPSDDTYVVSPQRRGIFVIKHENVITYLRLSGQLQTIARRLWPLERAVG